MVNEADKPIRKNGHSGITDYRQLAWASLVNSGQDTQITLHDGSIIVLKGVTRVEAVFPANVFRWTLKPLPIGGEIGRDGEHANRWRNGRESGNGIAEERAEHRADKAHPHL